ncbi:MAG: hypothetical protein SynsKO_20320 [Synoicihabitans sp.]
MLIVHFYLTTVNWDRGFLLNHEFRQTQTALITHFIDKQDNFSFYYETPLLGKPWVLPLEMPIYQWTVVLLMRRFDLPDYEAARTVSLTSFYLALAALYVLLGSFKLLPAHRALVLLPALACPIYIFYSRAFLIDPMATMFSAWFLAAFVRTMDQRNLWWLGLTIVAGTLGILLKSLVFAVWLFPAALYGAWCLWRVVRERQGSKAFFKTCGWGLAAALPPYIAIRDWLAFTDAIKASHRSAFDFTAEALSTGNFGTFDLSSRFSWETWQTLAERWSEAVIPAWVIGSLLVLGIAHQRRVWKPVLGLTGLWFFGQLAFPFAYAFQDYYFYAGSLFLMLALGVIMRGWLSPGRFPRPLGWGLSGSLIFALLFNYHTGYGPYQRVESDGGSEIAAALKEILPEDSVIVIIGQDWAGMTPYYARRRALMVRNPLRFDPDYLRGAIRDLDDEDVGALLVVGDSRNHPGITKTLTRNLGMSDRPLLKFGDSTDVYLGLPYYHHVFRELNDGTRFYHNVELVRKPDDGYNPYAGEFRLTASSAELAFPQISNGVVRKFDFRNGYSQYHHEERSVFDFHTESTIWVRPSERVGSFDWTFGMPDGAWDREGGGTDGVDFVVEAENRHGERREVARRELRPAEREADRGFPTLAADFQLAPDEVLVFRSAPNGHDAFDWAFVHKLEFR